MEILTRLYTFTAIFTAWIIGLRFGGTGKRTAGLFALAAAVIGTSAQILCAALRIAWCPMPVVFALLAVVLRQITRCGTGSVALIYLTAAAAWGVLDFSLLGVEMVENTAVLWLLLYLMESLMVVYSVEDSRFSMPEAWQDFYPPETQDGPLVYLLPALAFAAGTVLLPLVVPGTLAAYTAVLVMAQTVLWCAMAGCAAQAALQKEHMINAAEQNCNAELQTFMNVIRSQRHDYNFHLQTLAGMMAQGKWDQCREYVDGLVKDTIALNTALAVKDPAVAALISSFQSKAARYQIRLHLDIENDLSHIVTNAYETNKIIGNLLQNAIDEVSTHSDRSYGIHLSILKRGEFCMIHVSNRIAPGNSGEGSDIFRPGYTTKTGHEGVGLSSIRSLVSRYHGDVYMRLEDDIVHFVAMVPTNYTGGRYEE